MAAETVVGEVDGCVISSTMVPTTFAVLDTVVYVMLRCRSHPDWAPVLEVTEAQALAPDAAVWLEMEIRERVAGHAGA